MCSKGQLQKGDGVIRLGYTVFPFVMRVYATLEGLFLISSTAAIISFSSGTVMIPAARIMTATLYELSPIPSSTIA